MRVSGVAFLIAGASLCGGAAAEVVTKDMVACERRSAIYELAKATSDSEFFGKASSMVERGTCYFLVPGWQVDIVDSHWMGTVCVESDEFPGCLWVVRNAISGD